MLKLFTSTLMMSVCLVVATSAGAAKPKLINGAGASFPYPIYAKWFSEYRSVNPKVKINYQSIGSGGGIRQLLGRTVDFGASDAPMKESEMAKADTPVLHIPTVLGAVVVTYNVPGVNQPIKLDPQLVADIFLGKVTKWSDPRIAALNPGVKFPKKLSIMVVHRSDGSGTTAVFTDYLAKVSPTWKQKVGAGKSVKWPTGLGGKGNEGVAGLVKNNPGALGYAELIYAETNHLPSAQIKNPAGEYVAASTASVSKAAAGALKSMPKDYRVSITNSPGKGAYPISAFTYLLVYNKMPQDTGGEIVKFLKWALGPGQKMAEKLSYAPLPKSLVAKVVKTVDGISFK